MKGQVHYALFPRSDNIEVLVKYIQEKADLSVGSEFLYFKNV